MKKINEQLWRQLFSEKLKEIMQERNLTQKDMAMIAGVTQSQISRILSCKSTASIKVINNLSYSLRIKIDSLVLFKELFK